MIHSNNDFALRTEDFALLAVPLRPFCAFNVHKLPKPGGI